MPLDIPDGTACFIDANILYYALVPTFPFSDACLKLLNRATVGSITLFTSVPVLSDTLHKVMISEIAHLTKRERSGLIGYLGKHPEVIGQLTEYPQAFARLKTVPMTILPTDDLLLQETTRLAVAFRLLTNDAMIVSLMRRHQLSHLISNDDDFDGIPGLTIWKPR